jgi:hypothetical protein
VVKNSVISSLEILNPQCGNLAILPWSEIFSTPQIFLMEDAKHEAFPPRAQRL